MKKKNKEKFVLDKVSFRQCLSIFKGIKLPWTMMVAALVFTLLGAYAGVNVASFSGDMVDASGNLPMKDLIIFVLATLVNVALNGGALVIQGLASEKINFNLRKKLWKKIIFTKQSSYDKDGGETLVSRVTTDCDFASSFFTTAISIISLFVTSSMYLIEMYRLNVKMANYVLIFIPVSLIVGWGYTLFRFYVAQKTQAMLAESTNYLIERTKDIMLIKTSNAQEIEIQEGSKHFQEQYKMQMKAGYATALQTGIDSFLNILSLAIPFIVGAMFVQQGILTVGVIVTFNGLFGQVKTMFSNLILYSGNMKEANGALARVTRVFDMPEEQMAEGLDITQQPNEDVALEQVEFSYADKRTLKQFTVCIPKNKVTAVIGTNGSGKSTMFKLLERLYEPQSGIIRFGDKNSNEYNLGSWRKRFCMVEQGSPMMEGTIRENICYGCTTEVSEEELIQVAKLSHVYDFVEKLPDGFDTYVAAGGNNFSGGQKQCIAFARAMLRKGDYLLLDEATSNLDAKKERDVMDAMRALIKGRTTLIIAHSLAAIKDADYVLVINQGEVEAFGTPEDILQQTDNYLVKVMGRETAVSTQA